jgi:hypothetical protein
MSRPHPSRSSLITRLGPPLHSQTVPTEPPDRTVDPARLEASPVEAAPDDTPQQVSPEASVPAEVKALTPEPEDVATPSPQPVEAKSPGDDSHAATEDPDKPAAPPVDEASSTQPEAVRAEPALPEAKSPEESPANQGLKFDGFFRPPAGTATRGTPRRTTTQSNTQR